MVEWSEEFSKFFGILLIFAFLSLYFGSFKNSNTNQNLAQNKVQNTQTIYRKVYVNNGGGPAAVYYVRQ
jgi:hypothetical protein